MFLRQLDSENIKRPIFVKTNLHGKLEKESTLHRPPSPLDGTIS